MTLIYLIFAAWVVFGALFARWALRMKAEWQIVESFSRGFRSRMLLTSSDLWLPEIDEPHQERIVDFIRGLRWRYAVFFFIIPGLLFTALWLYI